MAADLGSGGSANPGGTAGSQVVAYQAEAPNAYEWTEVAYEYLIDGKLAASIRTVGGISTATVTGTCPYCKDDVNFSEVLDAVTGESMRTLRRLAALPAQADNGYVPLTVACSCIGRHPGRPAGVSHGCGINFLVEVRRDT